MLHVATVHFKSARWIPIQTKYLRENIPVAYETWTSLEGIDPAHGVHFDHVVDQKAPHPEKLNHLAIEIRHAGHDDDLLLFLDGDAFPIADMTPLLDALSDSPLVAVRRAENAGEPYPHPCFCLTTVGFWRKLPGDWSRGYTWRAETGVRFSDVGANLWRTLELQEVPWRELLRSNSHLPDDIRFGVYDGIVYHHGAGFHGAPTSSRHDVATGPRQLKAPAAPLVGPLVRRFNHLRRQKWRERREDAGRRHSEHVFQRVASGDFGLLGDAPSELFKH